MSKHIFVFLLVFVFSADLLSQQLPITDNYLFNPSSISPAFTGKYYKFQSILTYRHESTNIAGAPIVGNFIIDGIPHKNMGIGGNIILSKAGIYRNFTVNLNYAYHLQIAKEHFLSFGINAALYQNYLDLSDIITRNQDDPLIAGNTSLSETYFNAGLGFLYSWKDFNFCISFPLLFNNRSLYADNDYQHVLAMDRNWLVYANYTLNFHADWKLQFDMLFRQNQYSPWTIDVSALVKFRDNYWLGLLYRKTSIIGVTAGATIIDRIIINYNFEFSGFAMDGVGGGTHEISLGYRIFREIPKNLQIKDYVR
ncbi:MAG: PorP/SprF family type IX secretion system membrane protein [Bacteroidales bacterium]|nr:PorP/SprF family type IX secretion system membrane protein [Bacteroidales bacterium]